MQKSNDDYKGLYEQAKALPNVNYIGYVKNEEIRNRLQSYDLYCFLVYGKKHHVYQP